MIQKPPYRLIAAFLGCLFCIFSVGVPVVLASCPMTGSQELSCCPDSFSRAHPVLTAYKNTSCCQTKFAALRNTQEFIPDRLDVSKLDRADCCLLPALGFVPASDHANNFPARVVGSSSPAPSADLSILFSSLLI